MSRAIIAVMLLVLVPAAAAQTNNPQTTGQPKPPSTTTSRVVAPVGHRQPTQSSLPPSMRTDEGRRAADPLGPITRICRDC